MQRILRMDNGEEIKIGDVFEIETEELKFKYIVKEQVKYLGKFETKTLPWDRENYTMKLLGNIKDNPELGLGAR